MCGSHHSVTFLHRVNILQETEDLEAKLHFPSWGDLSACPPSCGDPHSMHLNLSSAATATPLEVVMSESTMDLTEHILVPNSIP